MIDDSGHLARRASAALLGAALWVCVGPSGHLAAQGWWSFEDRDYFAPLTSGVREPHVSALAIAWADRMAYLVEDEDPRRVWDIDLGVELPIAGWELGIAQGGRVSEGGLGIGLWLPIDFHMIEDFVDVSNPIVNTDYRFGGALKLQYGLTPERFLGLRVMAGHESTHLGDEFSVAGLREFPDTFERINVSWEFLDLGVLYEDLYGPVWSARVGVTTTLPFRDSYYSVDALSATQSALGPVTESSRWVDPYFGLEAEWEEALGSWGPYVSGEARWRSIYDYHKSEPEADEDRQLSFNLVVGVRKAGGGALGRASPFVRLYHGVNPHGQFRNQDDYTQFGIGLRLVR